MGGVTNRVLARWMGMALRVCLVALVVLTGVGVVYRWDRIGALSDWRWQVALTLIGVTVATWWGSIWARGAGRFPRTAALSIVGIVAALACFLVLVWTDLKMRPWVWACWWMSVVAGATGTHAVWLRMSMPSDRRKLVRFTLACAAATGAMLAGLALRDNILALPPTWLLWVMGTTALGSGAGSIALWLRGLRLTGRKIPTGVKIGWVAVAQFAVVGVAFYLGRVTNPNIGEIQLMPSGLAHLTSTELDGQIEADLERLKIISRGLRELERKSAVFSAQLGGTDARLAIYTPAQDDQLRAMFMEYLAYRDGLLRMVGMYAGFEAVKDENARARCIVMAYAAGVTVYDASLKLVANYRSDDMARRKLNEGEPRWGIPAGMFDRVLDGVMNEQNAQKLAEIGAYYDANRQRWTQAKVFAAEDAAWLAAHVDAAAAEVKTRAFGHGARLDELLARVKKDAYSPVYATQSVVSTWIGDTKLVRWEPLITHDQIIEMQGKLQPGDILLERRNWFLSNAFLPGFWPHAALYVGTPQDLERMGLVQKSGDGWTSSNEAVRRQLGAYLSKAHDGQAHTVIESISNGVVFNSLTESMHADYVAVLRPRLSEKQKAEAIAKAFSHIGKPYDFEFDFFTADRLVCTELVYRCYDGAMRFPLEEIAGRQTMPALGIARKFREERGTAGQQLDFVLFLDGVPRERCAKLAGEAVFCETVDRPQGFNE